MLRELHIRGLGVIGEAHVELAAGLNAVTGETGAGKTLLMTSLALLTGVRAEARLVASGADEALVEAILEPDDTVRATLAERGLGDPGRELVVARRVGADGRSRAWIEGRLVPISVLGDVCGSLVEIHGQGAGFALASASNQLAALDALAGSKDVLASYRDALGRAREMEAELERMSSASRERAREADYLRFQVEEIDSAGLSPDEEETLPVEIARLEHAERLVAAGAEASELTGSDGAAGRLAEAHKLIEDAVRIDPSLGALGQRVGALAAEAAEAAWDMRAWVEDLDPDPARLEVLRERAAAIGALKRKYGDTVAEVLAAAEQARVRLGELDSTAERGALLEASLAEAWTETEQRGAELSGLRGEAAVRLTELVNAELPDLALPGGLFHAVCEPADTFLQTGRDRVEFRFTADRSRPPDLLGKVASGGELSRAMIAVTLALAAAHPVGVLVFDEADAGVGGRAALELGRRLARLGTTHQVLVVTHLPQIAAMASHHVRVTKAGGTVAVEALAPPGRLEEVSRMLAGVTSSEAARAHAAELLEMGRERPGRRRAS